MLKKITLVLAVLGMVACTGGESDNSSSSTSLDQPSSAMAASSESEQPTSSQVAQSSSAFTVSSSTVSSRSSVVAISSSESVSSNSDEVTSSSSVAQSSSEISSEISSVSSVPQSTSSISSGDVDVQLGKALYETHCLECHGVTGGGAKQLPVPVESIDYDGIIARVDGGNMPSGQGVLTGKEYSPEQCEGDCAHHIASYITNGFPGALAPTVEKELGFAGCDADEGAPASRALRLLTRREYQNTINDIFGFDMDLTTNFSPEGRDHGFTNNADIAQVTARHLDNYYSAASRVTGQVQENLKTGVIGGILGCSDNFACIQKFVEEFGARLFRRPLTDEETTEYLAFFKAFLPEGQDEGWYNHSVHYKEAIGAGLPALLMSPHFFYRKELGTLNDSGLYQLDAYEVASLLSYTFIGSSPDDALMEAAENSALQTKAQFKAHAERLLQTPRGKDQMAHFAVEWWDAGLELIGSKNPDFYPGFGPDVIQAMVGEMQAFFKHVVFESSGKFSELYQPGYTLVNKTLSDFYKVGSASDENFVQVTTTERGGVLSLGAVMAAKASTEESSPVKRGVFVREQLMCDPLPPLPRDVNIPNPDLDPTKPMRERFTEHSANENCWACHKFFDDIGFAMESYDASGLYREREVMYDWDTKEVLSELDIVTAGKVINVDGDDELLFDDLQGLAGIMANADSTKSCMTTQYYRYVMGYSLSDADQCAIENLNKTFAESDFDIQSLLIGITQLDSFSLRQ